MKLELLGEPRRLIFRGRRSHQTRPPYPFVDVTGSSVEIGEEVVLSSGVYIHTHTHYFEDANWRNRPVKGTSTPTVISDHAFIGVNAQIMHTCKYIGKCSVVASGSIVTHDVPDYEIWAGNPARKIGDVEHNTDRKGLTCQHAAKSNAA